MNIFAALEQIQTEKKAETDRKNAKAGDCELIDRTETVEDEGFREVSFTYLDGAGERRRIVWGGLPTEDPPTFEDVLRDACESEEAAKEAAAWSQAWSGVTQ